MEGEKGEKEKEEKEEKGQGNFEAMMVKTPTIPKCL